MIFSHSNGRYGVHLAYTPMIHAEPFAADDTFRKTYFDAQLDLQDERHWPLSWSHVQIRH